MKRLTYEQVIELHRRVVAQSGGADGLRDRGALESSLAQADASFGGTDLYPGLIDKAAVTGFFVIANHPFVDGNKRIGHAVMEATLMMNGLEMAADVDDAERVILAVAAGQLDREGFVQWVKNNVAGMS